MKKVVDFLEQHVQWLAIGLGAAFLLAMAWYYIITPPVVATIGKENYGPGDIDKYILENPIEKLNADIHGQPKPIQLPKPDWLTAFQSKMDFSDNPPVALSRPWVNSPPLPMTATSKLDREREEPILEKVAQIPEVPAATMGGWTMGTSTVNNPGSEGAGSEKNWVAITYLISNVDQAAAFAAIKLPAVFYPTEILEVKLYRQQELATGQWSNDTLVRRLPFESLMAFPAETAPKNDKSAYEKWAADNQRPILQPEFYNVVSGDPFSAPPLQPKVEAKVAVTEGLPNFDPNRFAYSAEEWKQMTPEQRKLAQAAVKKHDDEEREKQKEKNRGNSNKGSKGGRSSGGATGAHSGDDADRPNGDPPATVPNPYDSRTVAYAQQPPPPTGDRNGDRAGDRGEDAGNERGGTPFPGSTPAPAPAPAPATGAPQQPGAAPSTQPDEHPCPTGAYDASTSPPSWAGWSIDDTVEPGKVYRYRVVYSIKNPMWNTPNACVKPEMAEQLAISSDVAKTAWSLPIKVPSRTSFYIAQSLSKNSLTVSFEVFATQGGTKKKQDFTVAPGDMIGAPKDDVNYVTDSTLVDIVLDPRLNRYYALVADAAGNISRRDFDSDQNNPDRKADVNAVNRSSASAAPAPAAGGSVVTGNER